MNEKIIAGGNLENIVGRLIYCRALLDAIRMAMECDPLADAVAGAGDLLGTICRDFQADIDAAEEFTREGAAA